MLGREVVALMPAHERHEAALEIDASGTPPVQLDGRRDGRLRAAWDNYPDVGLWDEMLVRGQARDGCAGVVNYLSGLGDNLIERQHTADLVIKPMTALSVDGITGTARSAEGDLVLVVGLSFLMDGCRGSVRMAA